jgi:hypothetical protein
MRIQLMTAAAVVLLSAAGATAQPRPDSALIGTWKSAPDELKLTTDFDKSVWGANASSVRTVELVVRSQTEATLKVVKKVLNAKRQTVPASTWIEEADLQLGAAAPGVADRLEHEVTVTKAVRLFPDDPNYKWPLDGLKVKVVTFTDRDPNTLEVRYDTADGRGSFWETLKKAVASTPKSQPPTPKSQPPTPKK